MTEELNNLYTLARRAKAAGDSEEAKKYYDMIVVQCPNDWESSFFSVYFGVIGCKISDITFSADRIQSAVKVTLQLIKDNLGDAKEISDAANTICIYVKTIAKLFSNAATNHYNGIAPSVKYQFDAVYYERVSACFCLEYNTGNWIIDYLGSEFKNLSVELWKEGITLNTNRFIYFYKQKQNKELISKYEAKIKQYEPSYSRPDPMKTKDGVASASGCYVATAVYGSYDCPQVWTLRRYRDYTLAETWYGRAFIKTYYAISPTLVKWFGHTDWFRKMWKGKLDRMVSDLNAKGVNDSPYVDKEW